LHGVSSSDIAMERDGPGEPCGDDTPSRRRGEAHGPAVRRAYGGGARIRPAVGTSRSPTSEGGCMNIRPNRVKEKLAAGQVATIGKRGMYTSRQGFGVDGYLKTANDQSLLIVLIEDIVAVRSLDEILKVDHIDCFFVAPSDLATSMGQIGNMGHPDVQQTIDGAIKKIVQSGRVAGTLVNVGNVERYTRLGVRVVMTRFVPWIQAGAKELIERAA